MLRLIRGSKNVNSETGYNQEKTNSMERLLENRRKSFWRKNRQVRIRKGKLQRNNYIVKLLSMGTCELLADTE